MSTTAGGPPAPEHHGAPDRHPGGEVEVVLSAERVDVAVHRLPRERVRLRREIHTREVEVTVVVRREVLRVERLPVGSGDLDAAALTAPAADAPVEITLHEERPVVGVQAVPYERVRIAVEAVPSTSRVDTTAAHEVVDVTTGPADLQPSPDRVTPTSPER